MTLVEDRQMTLWGWTGDIGGKGQVALAGQTGDFRVDRQGTLEDERMTLGGWTGDTKSESGDTESESRVTQKVRVR